MITDQTNNRGRDTVPPMFQQYYMLDYIHQPGCVFDMEGNLVYSNRQFSELYPTSNSDVRLDFENPLFPEYRKKVAQCYLSAKSGHIKQCFAMINSPEGSHLPVEIYFIPVFKNEAQSGIVSIIKIVDPKSASIAKSGSRLLFEHRLDYDDIYFEFSPMNIIRLNDKSEIIKYSRSLEAFIGYNREELLEKQTATCKTIFPNDSERIKKAILEIYSGSIPFQRIGEIKIVSKDESTKIVNLVIYSVASDNDTKAVDLVLEDITKIKLLEEKINTMQRVQLMSDITQGFLHSLNNTLNIILSKSQMLLQISDKPMISDGIQLIEESSLNIYNQIRRLQNFIGDQSQLTLEKTEPCIHIIEDAIEFARLKFKVEDRDNKRNIIIDRKYFFDFNITADTKTLREIIISMIIKLSSYIPKKGTISISTKENSDIYINVYTEKSDMSEATAISEDALNLFSGLNIRQVAEKMGIKILEEESPQGYSMKAIVPRRLTSSKNSRTQLEPEFKIRDFDILIVEDEKTLRNIMFELFDKMGNRVSVFGNGKEAIDAFKLRNYDLLITDYDIEGITGIELASRIKEINDNTATILLSGWMLNNLDSYQKVVDIFIPKPFRLDELIKHASKLIHEKKKFK